MAELKYGVESGVPNFTIEGGFLASDVLSAKSGRYVVYDISDGYWRALNDGESAFGGYVEQHLTCSATSGATKLPIATNIDQIVCKLPYSFDGAAAILTQDVLDTLGGKLIDLYVASNIQYADNRTSVSDACLQVVGGKAGATAAESYLLVKVVPTKMVQAS